MSRYYGLLGDAYIRDTNYLVTSTIFDVSFNDQLRNSATKTNPLAYGVELGNRQKVKIGFKNVLVESMAGETISLANKSQNVSKGK